MATVDIAQLTYNQPFCAGAIILDGSNLLITLNRDGLPPGLKTTGYRVGGVGGGQEPGESIWQCAVREAKEETCCDVQLISSQVTYFHDLDTDEISTIEVVDHVAPLLFERMSNPHPDKPYRPGLPIGPYIYFGLFLGNFVGTVDPTPGDDVCALVKFPIDRWIWLNAAPRVLDLMEVGVEVIGCCNLEVHRILWLPRNESFTTVVKLLSEEPLQLGG